jgi:hypothetical protein
VKGGMPKLVYNLYQQLLKEIIPINF